MDKRADKWIGCGGIDYVPYKEGATWIYSILKNKYKILIFSGDTDGVIPTLGTRKWI